MAIEIGALRALLSLDSAAFEKGAKRAEASMGGLEKRLRQASKRMGAIGKKMSTRVTAPLAAAAGAMVRSSLSTVDAQAKMAQSLDTSVKSLQVLTRAADMAGISQGELEGSLLRMTRRISLAEQGLGAGRKAFDRLNLSAADFADLNADERVKLIQDRLREMVPEAERAGVASMIFGDRTGLAMSRLDPATINAATKEIERFGVAVSDADADQIEVTNDAIAALGLVTRGLANQIAVALAPTLQRVAENIADLAAWFSGLSPQMKRFAAVSVTIAAAIGPVAVALGFMAAGLAALASPIGIVIVGLGAAAAAAAYVVTQWDELKARFPILERLEALGGALRRHWENMPSLKWALLIPALRWARFIPGLRWASFVAALGWGKFVRTIRWATLAGSLRWSFLIRPLVWGARFIPVIGWATLAGTLAWGVLIKPLGWDKYIARINWRDYIPQINWDNVFGGARGGSSQTRAIGRDLGRGVAEGVDDAVPEIDAAARRAARRGEGAFRDESETRSPSRVFMRIGRDLMEGAAVGIDQAATGAASASAKAAQKASDAFEKAGGATGKSKLEQRIESVSAAMGQAIVQGRDMGQALAQVFRQIAADLISSQITRAITELAGAFGFGGGGTSLAPATSPRPRARPPSFSGGGWTGNAPRAGGLDGQGGFPAMLHPREHVIDTTKGGGLSPTINMPVTISNEAGVDVQAQPAPGGGLDVRVLPRAVADTIGSGGVDRAMRQRFGLTPKAQGGR